MTTIVTTCMGRLSFLKQALPTWLLYTELPVLVIDYSCPDFTADYIDGLHNPRVEAMRVTAAVETSLIFNKSRALNIAIERLWLRRESRVLLLDADTTITYKGDLVALPNEMWIAQRERDLTGVLLAETEAILSCDGGFDEHFVGWAPEDLDLRLRLYCSARKPALRLFPDGWLCPLPHGDELRGRFSPHSPATTMRLGLERMMMRLISRGDYEALRGDKHLPLLLGSPPAL